MFLSLTHVEVSFVSIRKKVLDKMMADKLPVSNKQEEDSVDMFKEEEARPSVPDAVLQEALLVKSARNTFRLNKPHTDTLD